MNIKVQKTACKELGKAASASMQGAALPVVVDHGANQPVRLVVQTVDHFGVSIVLASIRMTPKEARALAGVLVARADEADFDELT